MTTNREWLYSLDVADLAEWFDAEHDEDMSFDAALITGVDDECDSREKLEADVRKWCAMMGMQPYQLDFVYGWLDRQAAITRAEYEFARKLDKEATEFMRDKVAELTAERDTLQGSLDIAVQNESKLEAQVDELSQQLINSHADCEQYRELFSEAITRAAEIVNLQP